MAGEMGAMVGRLMAQSHHPIIVALVEIGWIVSMCIVLPWLFPSLRKHFGWWRKNYPGN